MQPVVPYVAKLHKSLWEDAQVKVLLGQCIRLEFDATRNAAHLEDLRLSGGQKPEECDPLCP